MCNSKDTDSRGVVEPRSVMKMYYGIDGNNCGLQTLNSTYISKITKHCRDGAILLFINGNIIKWDTINGTKDLIADIPKTGHLYIPIYSACHNKTDDTKDCKLFFIVTNHNRKGDILNFGELKEFAIQMCDKHNQEYVIMKTPDGATCLYSRRSGGFIDESSANKIIENDPAQIYLVSLIEADKKTHKQTAESKPHSEYYVNPSPCTLNERRHRDMRGEMIFGRWHNGKFFFE